MVGGIQTDVLRSIVKRDSELITSGFLARCLIAFPPPKPIFWNDNTVDPAILSDYEKLIKRILVYRDDYTPDNPGVITLSPEARDSIMDFQHRQATKMPSTANVGVASVLNKAGMHCARLALNLHVIKYAAGVNFAQYSVVSDHTMLEAIELTEWFLNEAFRLYAMFDGSDEPDDSEAMKVKSKIMQLGGRADYRRLHGGIADFHSLTAKEVKIRLGEMVDAGLLSIQKEKAKNGREVEYYAINTSTLNTINTVTGVSSSIDCSDDDSNEYGVDALSVDSVDNVDASGDG
jgi:hypothetical protein